MLGLGLLSAAFQSCGGEVRVGREAGGNDPLYTAQDDGDGDGGDVRFINGGTGGTPAVIEGAFGGQTDTFQCVVEYGCGFDFTQLCEGDCPRMVREVSLTSPTVGVELIPAPAGGVVLRTGQDDGSFQADESGYMALFDAAAQVVQSREAAEMSRTGKIAVTSEGRAVALTQVTTSTPYSLRATAFGGDSTVLFDDFLLEDFVAVASGGFLISGTAQASGTFLGAQVGVGPATIFVEQDWLSELEAPTVSSPRTYARVVAEVSGVMTQVAGQVFLQERAAHEEYYHLGTGQKFTPFFARTTSPPPAGAGLGAPLFWFVEGQRSEVMLVRCQYNAETGPNCQLSVTRRNSDGTLQGGYSSLEIPVQLLGVFGKSENDRLLGYGQMLFDETTPLAPGCLPGVLFELDLKSGEFIWQLPFPYMSPQLGMDLPITVDDQGRLVIVHNQALTKTCNGSRTDWQGQHRVQLIWLER